jgi:hypothetical protein
LYLSLSLPLPSHDEFWVIHEVIHISDLSMRLTTPSLGLAISLCPTTHERTKLNKGHLCIHNIQQRFFNKLKIYIPHNQWNTQLMMQVLIHFIVMDYTQMCQNLPILKSISWVARCLYLLFPYPKYKINIPHISVNILFNGFDIHHKYVDDITYEFVIVNINFTRF